MKVWVVKHISGCSSPECCGGSTTRIRVFSTLEKAQEQVKLYGSYVQEVTVDSEEEIYL